MRRLLPILALSALLPVLPALGDDAVEKDDSGTRAPFDPVAALGLEVDDAATPWTIVDVAPDSPAERAGFAPEDRILRIGGRPLDAAYADAVGSALGAAREARGDAVHLELEVLREGEKRAVTLTASLREIDVSVAVTKALDYLADELASDPSYEKTRPRAFYAPIVYAPLAGLAFLAGGSTRAEGRHAAALRTALAYVVKHGGIRKENQDEINKSVRGNICSLTHNAGFSAMFLAQLIDREFPRHEGEPDGRTNRRSTKLTFSEAALRKKLRACCKTLEDLQLENGGWQHGSGGANMLGYTHLTAATVTALNGLAMAKQVGVKVRRSVLDKGLAYVRKATNGGHVGYAVGNKGSFSAGRNAGILQVLSRLGLHDDELVKPVAARLAEGIGKAGTGHGSPVWHLFYVGPAAARLSPETREEFDGLYRKRLLRGQGEDGSIRAPEPAGAKPGSGEENRVWGALYTTPLIALVLLAPWQPRMLIYRFGADGT